MSETSGGCVYDGMPTDGVSVDIGPGARIGIAGAVLFSGYRVGPALTAEARDGGWFVTSDLGSIGPSGEVLVRGRADDVIITGGEKVVAAQVEAALGTCVGVREAVVVGRPDAEWGEVVTAVVVPADPSAPPGLADIRAHVQERLPACAAPGALVLVPEIPLLPSGKPDREALRAVPRGGAQPGPPAGARHRQGDKWPRLTLLERARAAQHQVWRVPAQPHPPPPRSELCARGRGLPLPAPRRRRPLSPRA